MDCQICCEKFNKSNHCKVVCNYCQYTNCRECFQKYLVDTILDPHCMNCKKVYLHEFLTENCTAIFINKTLKNHREHVLFDREKALMPMSQNDVVLTKERCEHEKNIKRLLDEKNELMARLRKNSRELQDSRTYVYEIDRILGSPHSGNTEVKKFVRKCPMEECRGFLSTQWKCGTCEVNICKNCNEVKDIFHIECDPDKVKTMELINKDTKPCPKCGTMIFKISGCDQMFCIDCHTVFSWNRATIVNDGIIHNPHYYEFLRKQNNGVIPRNPGDIPCGGGLPYWGEISRRFLNPRAYTTETQIITNFHQLVAHITHQEIRDLNRSITMNNSANRKLRVQYLMNVLTENNFKAIIQQLEKKNNKSREYINIYQMLVDVSSDKFREIQSGTGLLTIEELTEIIQYFDKLIEYFNENIANVGKRYKCVYPGIMRYKLYQNALKTNTIRN
jgi:hypothetical protein